MRLNVDKRQRFAKMRAHTAAHLLHAELIKIFPNTKQAGSFVDSDYLRFDFQTDRMITEQEIAEIEKNINQHIYNCEKVESNEMSIDDANKLWAKAFFEDKYWDIVRVVQVDKWISTELCGGTHISNTKEIGAFAIVGQEAIASGIKRISAYTGPKVLEIKNQQNSVLSGIIGKIGVKSHGQISDKLDKVITENKELAEKVESLQTKIIWSVLGECKFETDENFEKKINISKINELKDLKFKDIVLQAKILFTDNVLVFNEEWNFAVISASGEAKNIAGKLWLKWGWNDNLIQGRDWSIVK